MSIPYKALLILVLTLGVFFSGVLAERFKLVRYQGEVQGAAFAQAALAKQTDQTNKDNANATSENYIQALYDLHNWYQSHPVVRVQHDNNTCTVSQTSGNSKGTNAGTTTGYYGQYPEETTEGLAIQLKALQELLIKDGVEVK